MNNPKCHTCKKFISPYISKEGLLICNYCKVVWTPQQLGHSSNANKVQNLQEATLAEVEEILKYLLNKNKELYDLLKD